mmetsp:Transcript_37654/g.57685  ORF Transcript_37654/g.57685 Transcript_37654/m.57685 type:complete len:86 (+) Transcript_37654:903-1160(+)
MEDLFKTHDADISVLADEVFAKFSTLDRPCSKIVLKQSPSLFGCSEIFEQNFVVPFSFSDEESISKFKINLKSHLTYLWLNLYCD